MSPAVKILLALSGVALLAAALRFSFAPLRWANRALRHSVAALAGLIVVNWVGAPLGIGLGVNVVNALVVGLLGLPGFGMLLVFPWLLRR